MHRSRELELQQLLTEGQWLRRFVATLVAPQDVDDVVQSTWLAALQHSHVAKSLQRWLLGTSANLARLLHRRENRRGRALKQVARQGDAPPADELVASLEVQRIVSDALLELPEPTRTIVLLRYHQGLDPTAIGTRVGLLPDAVRQRLHRGRDAVRERLQQRFGEDWRGCIGSLAFLRWPHGAVGTTAVRHAAAWAGGVAAASALIVVSLGAVHGALPEVPPAANTTAALPAVRARDEVVASPGVPVERVLMQMEQDPQRSPPANTIAIRGRLVAAESGAPVQGTLRGPLHGPAETTVATATDGTFAAGCSSTRRNDTLWFECEGRCLRWYEVAATPDRDLGDIPMQLGFRVLGHVVDEAGVPVRGLRIETPLDGEFPSGGTFGFCCSTDEAGRFLTKQLLPAGRFELRSGTAGLQLVDGTIEILAQKDPTAVKLTVRRLPAIRGVCFDAQGVPVGGVSLQTTNPNAAAPFLERIGSCRSKPDGSFELFRERGTEESVDFDTEPFAAHEIVAAARDIRWGTSGLRVVVRPQIPVTLRVVAGDTGRAIEDLHVALSRRVGASSLISKGGQLEHVPDGLVRHAGLADGTRIEIFPADPMLAPCELFVDEAMRGRAETRVAIARLQPFPLVLVDGAGAPIQAQCELLERCGTDEGTQWSDRRTGRSVTPTSPLRISSCTTDARGHATLLAPMGPRDMVLAVPHGPRVVWLHVQPAAPGAEIRLVVP